MQDQSKCLQCSVEYSRQRSNQRFCTAHCRITYNRHWLKGTCVDCGCAIANQSTRCKTCNDVNVMVRTQNSTLEDYMGKLSLQGKHPSWRNVHIREFARSWNKELRKEPCRNCTYTKHVELAHIKGIVTFEPTTLLKEVNSPDNLLPLCPNCHWEFDNGLLTLEEISSPP